MAHLYFAYGSNLSEDQMRMRCPGSRLLGNARLPGYSLAFTAYSKRREGGVADIIESPLSSVWGLVYELTDDDLNALDGFECCPGFYERIEVRVKADAPMTAWAYTIVGKEGHVQPADDYIGLIIEGAKEHGFPSEYVRLIRSIGEGTSTDTQSEGH